MSYRMGQMYVVRLSCEVANRDCRNTVRPALFEAVLSRSRVEGSTKQVTRGKSGRTPESQAVVANRYLFFLRINGYERIPRNREPS